MQLIIAFYLGDQQTVQKMFRLNRSTDISIYIYEYIYISDLEHILISVSRICIYIDIENKYVYIAI